ncbi:MAG TPA: hypothetical protein VKV26_24245 [Dehalococcoidia bacterium]|nr:hypothetical protein [Dehalococcoidia bacterium]
MKLRLLIAPVLALSVVLALACSSNNNAGKPAPASNAAGGSPAATRAAGAGNPVDGIPCETSERLTYHVHAHLTIIANGQGVAVPANTGIVDNRCIYWLHTHDTSGVIHIEAPSQRAFTLGEFFDVWGQPLSATQVLGFRADGTRSFQFFVDGQPYSGDPRQVPLGAHTLITIEYGPPFAAPPPFTFPPGL